MEDWVFLTIAAVVLLAVFGRYILPIISIILNRMDIIIGYAIEGARVIVPAAMIFFYIINLD